MRYFLKFSYNGTNYAGWQIQNNAITVQEIINEKMSLILKTPIETLGAGRTDTGVHAKEMYLHFDHAEEIDKSPFLNSLNKILPHDIAVQDLLTVKETAHARFDAKARTYEYYITSVKDPFLQNQAAYYYGSIDIAKMNDAAKVLFEYIDFSSFSKSNTQTFTNNCKITFAEWRTEENLLIFKITADRFLRNMVRAIVGTLLQVGKEKITKDDVRKIIDSKNRSNAGDSVVACGLYLMEVRYNWDEILIP